jgi:hypothetical protein
MVSHFVQTLKSCSLFGLRNESFNFTAGSMTPKLFVWIYDHKTIGKDKMLAQGEIDVCPLFSVLWIGLNSL